jgi:branched-chain amino acid transport system substrate-binding protein
MGYDAYNTALAAIAAAGSVDSKAIMQALPGVTTTGVSGAIAFDEIDDAVRDTAYIKTANTETGLWDFVAVQSVK